MTHAVDFFTQLLYTPFGSWTIGMTAHFLVSLVVFCIVFAIKWRTDTKLLRVATWLLLVGSAGIMVGIGMGWYIHVDIFVLILSLGTCLMLVSLLAGEILASERRENKREEI